MYPWGAEAFAKARSEGKPIFLSIGYSTCHWCHVMEHDTFENPEAAAAMNDLFVNIKVDREEHPDVDALYMAASQALTGYGGWPLNLFCTPDLEPYYSAGYMPPYPSRGMPGFIQVAQILAHQFHQSPDEIAETGRQLKAMLAQRQGAPSAEAPSMLWLEATLNHARGEFDQHLGGFGHAPKFPPGQLMVLLLRHASMTGDHSALDMVDTTLEAMARGGMYDQIGGGFHRYSTDARWLVPHFEKMLYDNALLLQATSEAFRLTGNAEYRRIAQETATYLLRDMRSPEGAFYSAEDADSLPPGVAEGGHKEEGAFYVFSEQELRSAIADVALAELAIAFYGVTKLGNFEGANILHVPLDRASFARKHDLRHHNLETDIERIRAILLGYRSKRPRPHLDDKVLTSWNGLAIGAFAIAGLALEDPALIEAARKAADFVLATLRTTEGKLLRRYRAGEAGLSGSLEDYSFLANGLLDLYLATFETRYLTTAIELATVVRTEFVDPAGGFFLTTADTPHLLVRPKDGFDNATPSSNSMAALVCARLSEFTGDQTWRDLAHAAIQSQGGFVQRVPTAFSTLLQALLFLESHPHEIVIVGPRADPRTQGLIAEIRRGYRPHLVALLADPAAPPPTPLAADRPMLQGVPTAYVCRHFACGQPTTDPHELARQLVE